MKNLIDDVKRHTTKSVPGYHYLKTQNIYIPFMKITVECLTRKISELNLFFESILKLIDISVKDINEIAKILGVSYSVVKEAIIDMVGMDYIYVSENTLGITAKGGNALKTRQRVDIQKTYLKDIMVDMITGIVYDADSVRVSKIKQRDVLLDAAVQLDGCFLDSHFREINEVYQQQQKNNSVFGNNAIISELYKTIRISYSELHYVENRLYLYGSESSDELLFEFSSDNNDRYKNEFYKQLKDSCRPCQEFFFEKNKALISHIQSGATQIDVNAMMQTENTKKLLFADNVTEEQRIDAFTQRRYSLNDTEHLSYLYNSNSLRYSAIYICSDHMQGLLSHAFCSQLNVLAQRIPVFIIYDKKEKNIDNSLQYFFSAPSANLQLVPSENIGENLICFDSELVIYLHENVVTAFDRPVVYMLPIYDFSKKAAKETVEKLVSKYSLKVNITNNSQQNRNQKRKKYKN